MTCMAREDMPWDSELCVEEMVWDEGHQPWGQGDCDDAGDPNLFCALLWSWAVDILALVREWRYLEGNYPHEE